MNKLNYNIVLSGGGARGYAHIGILQALLEQNLSITAISGTSAGALIGALICDGYTPIQIKEIILKEEPKISWSALGFKEGFFSSHTIHALLKKYLRSKTFADLKLPLFVSLTNLANGEGELINQGELHDVLLAASAIPAIFSPVMINQIPYADGGMTNNLPIEPFQKSKYKTIACHVNPLSPYSGDFSTAKIIDRSMHIVLRHHIKQSIHAVDLFIEPTELHQFHLFDTRKAEAIIQIGYEYVKENVKL